AAERRHEQATQAAELRAQAPSVLDEIEGLINADYGAVRGQWQALRRKWQAIQRTGDLEAGLADRYAAAAAQFETKEAAVREGKTKQQQENLTRLQGVVAALEARAAAETISLKDADAIVKDVKLAIGTMGPLPAPQDREDITVRLQAVRAAVQPRLDELRNAEEWKRWANVQVQEELCGKMEALIPLADTDPAKAAEEMRQLQEKWKPVAAAPRSQGEALWTRFKAAQSAVYEKCKDFFSQQAAERQEALKKKEALCEKAEALQDSTDWVKTAEAMKVLQAEWKAIGPVTRGREKAVWERFRKACDAFFTRRQADMKQRKNEWGENLAKKEALIAEAEQLAQSTNWDQAASRLKALQAQWKTIGPVKKAKSDQVWEQFRAACDLFFERFKNRDQEAIQTKFVDRDTAVAEIEALVPEDGAAMPDDLFNKVQAARARWLQGPELPRHVLSPLADRVNAALLALVTRWPDAFTGSDLDPAATAKRMEKLCAKVEALYPRRARRVRPRSCRRLNSSRVSGARRSPPTPWRRRGQAGRGGTSAGAGSGVALGPVGVAASGPGAHRRAQAAAGSLRQGRAARARRPPPSPSRARNRVDIVRYHGPLFGAARRVRQMCASELSRPIGNTRFAMPPRCALRPRSLPSMATMRDPVVALTWAAPGARVATRRRMARAARGRTFRSPRSPRSRWPRCCSWSPRGHAPATASRWTVVAVALAFTAGAATVPSRVWAAAHGAMCARPRLVTALLVGWWCVVATGGLEIAASSAVRARLVQRYTPTETALAQQTEDWRLSHIMSDDHREPAPALLWQPVARPPHSRQRFRGPEVVAAKPAGTLRVMCFGDSNTDGPLEEAPGPSRSARCSAAQPRIRWRC
ncbi:MAG: DUF349 domain-containing protein, partial [Vicinamibacterales bacterium]